MKKYLTIEKKTGRVVMYSDGLNIVDEDKFEQKEVNIKQTDLDKMNDPNATTYKNKKFEFKPFKKPSIDKEALKAKLESNISVEEKVQELTKIIDYL